MKIFLGFDFVVRPLHSAANFVFRSESDSEISRNSSLDVSLRPSVHHWTSEERTLLCLLERWFISASNPKNKSCAFRSFQEVFRAFFAGESIETQQGFDTLTLNSLNMQLRDMWQLGGLSDEWRAVYQDTDFLDVKGDLNVTKRKVNDIIAELGIELVERSSEDANSILSRMGNGLNKKRRRKIDNISSVLGGYFDLDSEEEGERMVQRKKRHVLNAAPSTPKNRMRKFGLMTPPTSSRGSHLLQRSSFRSLTFRTIQDVANSRSPLFTKSQSIKDKKSTPKIPPIVFRVNDDLSHTKYQASGSFRAGAFSSDLPAVAPPPDNASDTFKEAATIHLRRVPSASSFISVTESPLRILHYGLRSTSNAHIALIDLSYINEHQQHEFPRLYSAGMVIRQLSIGNHVRKSGQEYHFSGAAEWIVWGEIEKDAIITKFTIADLELYLAQNPALTAALRLDGFRACFSSRAYNRYIWKTKLPLSRSVGETIGHFLAFTGLPRAHLSYTAMKFAKKWQFIGTRSKPRKDSFLAGAHKGFRRYHGQITLPQDNGQPILPKDHVESNFTIAPVTSEARDVEGVMNEDDEDSDGTIIGEYVDDFMDMRQDIEALLGISRY